MRLVDEMPKSGSFVAVHSCNGFVSAEQYTYINGEPNILCYGGDYGDCDVWKRIEQFEIDDMVSNKNIKYVVE